MRGNAFGREESLRCPHYIATLLDDISVMGKLAAKKTAGVLGDDLSLNAQQVSGVRANRELPVVWARRKDR